jgi:hypothetical protein
VIKTGLKSFDLADPHGSRLRDTASVADENEFMVSRSAAAAITTEAVFTAAFAYLVPGRLPGPYKIFMVRVCFALRRDA